VKVARRNDLNDLIQERNELLDRYIRARGQEKIRILARLMDIDDELEAMRRAERRMES
jgi:hypothetical protein